MDCPPFPLKLPMISDTTELYFVKLFFLATVYNYCSEQAEWEEDCFSW